MAVSTTALIAGANLWWLRRTRRSEFCGAIAVSAFFILLNVSNFSTGGFYDPNFGWLYIIPVFAALLSNMTVGAVFTGLVLLSTCFFWMAPDLGIQVQHLVPEDMRHTRSLFDRAAAVLSIGVAIAILAGREKFGRKRLSDAYESLKQEMQQREQLHSRMIHTERLASMGKLSAAVAHEINNPMTYVIGNLQALQEELPPGDNDHQELVGDALDGARRVSELVKDMQVYSRTPDNQQLDTVDVASVLETAAKMISNKVRHCARFRLECEPDLHALASEAQLIQVIVNLLTNAIDAIQGSIDDNEVALLGRMSDGGVEIVVKDSGSGIPAEVQARLFEPFYTTKDVGEGTGMGLAISRSLMEGMQGTIAFDSTEGTGTRFTLVLPPAKTSQTASLASEEVSSESVSTPTRRQILVIDDDAAVLRSIQRMLNKHEVTTEGDARRALELCEHGEFDMILCDIMMPIMSGDRFFSALQDAKPRLAERVVFMTGGVLTQDTEDFLGTVDRPVLSKPLNTQQVRNLANHASRPP